MSKDRYLGIYEKLLLTRKFDEMCIRLFKEGNSPGFLHSGIGQEAISVGSLYDAREDDYVFIHHRGFGYLITKNLSLEKVAAEWAGRATGYGRGKGGFHISDPSKGVLGISGSVGECFPMSVGAALTAQFNKKNQVVFCFFGDGTANREVAGSSMNLASVWKSPVIFICENNGWALTVPIEKSTATKHLSDRAAAYNMPGIVVDGNDVTAVNEAVNKAVERARNGEGPSFIECMTYRWQPHAEGYPYFGAEKSAEEGKKHCPIEKFSKLLRNYATEEEISNIEKLTDNKIEEVYNFVINSPFPKGEEALEGLYV